MGHGGSYITSFSHTTILYGSTHKRISEYTTFYLSSQPETNSNSIHTIVTNKVTFSLDLQTIENYVKNTNHIEAEGAEIPHLP